MSFKKVRMGRGHIVDLEIKDQDGRKDGKWVIMLDDLPEASQIIFKKYGLPYIIKELEKKNKDLDWAL